MTEPQGVQAFHQLELDAGRFLIQRCSACSKHVFFPRESCPHCGSAALEWTPAKGTGTIHAVTTMRRKPADGGDINVSLIDLDEGVRMMSRVENLAPGEVRIGQRVKARVQVKDGRGLVLFDAIEGAAA
ncbi:MAG TPA: OB-fold domain-containing protein [Ramlibacter sp.]|nr:OB-fold domain-containing protein [Ramlibacter sp.]